MTRAALTALALLLALPPAVARAEMPAGAWTIAPIAAAAANGVTYCSMKNSYPSGTTLVFARDSRGSSSIAVDFQGKNPLSAGKKYDVMVEAGFVSRTYVGLAATADVLLMQVGEDPELYNTIRQKDMMLVSFDNKSLKFGLKGTADAMDALAECAAGKQAAQPAAAAAAPSMADQAMVKTLQDEVDRLRGENRQLMMENQKILSEIKTTKTADDKIDPATVAKLQDRAYALEQENKKLKDELAAAQAAPEPVPVPVPAPEVDQAIVAGLQAEAEQLRAEKKQLESKLAETAAASTETAALAAEGEKLRAEGDKLRAEGEKLRAENAALRQAHDKANAELEKLRAESAGLAAQKPDPALTEKLAAIEAENKKLDAENRKLQAALSAAAEEAARIARAPVAAAETKPAVTETKPAVPAPKIAAQAADILPGLLQLSGITARLEAGVYRWQSGAARGLARTLGKGGLEALARRHVEAVSCAGDYASQFGPVLHMGDLKVQKAEAACLTDDDSGEASALVFIEKAGDVAVIGYSAATDSATDALAQRDRVLSSLSGR